jgi:hypothetical protein
LLHDFLWRTSRDLPELRWIGIFNRSYYEEVLIVRVHPEILHSEGLPGALLHETAVWHDRYRSVVDLEETPPRQWNPHRQVLPSHTSLRPLSMGWISLRRDRRLPPV